MQPLYDPEAVRPMWEELAQCGVDPLNTPDDVSQAMGQTGTTLMIVNSVCGCAAGSARPGVTKALQNSKIPTHLKMVFAGVDRDATEKAREFMRNHHVDVVVVMANVEHESELKLSKWHEEYCASAFYHRTNAEPQRLLQEVEKEVGDW